MSALRNDEMVEPLYPRQSDAVPGPFYVAKDECIICDYPPTLAPKCVKMKQAECPTDMYCHVYRQPTTQEELNSMYEAMWGSCVQAIRYCGTNPEILTELRKRGLSHLCDAIEGIKREQC